MSQSAYESLSEMLEEYRTDLRNERKKVSDLEEKVRELERQVRNPSEETIKKGIRKIVDEHSLWGHAIEIVKNLRDGMPSTDSYYQNLCLGGILFNFAHIDTYLDILPKDSCPTFKELLHELNEKYQEEDSSSESSEESESSSESSESEDSDTDPRWNEIPDYAWDYSNAEWISELYKIKEDKSKSVLERVEKMLDKIADFEVEIASRKVAEQEEDDDWRRNKALLLSTQ